MRPQRLTRLVAGALAALALSVTLHAATDTVVDAAMAGDHDAVVTLLRQGADVNTTRGDGVTALHWAARRADADLTKTLLVAGANPRAATRLGAYTPLHLAAGRGAAGVVTALVQAGGSVDGRTATGATALMFAAAAGSIDAVRALVDAGADVNAKETDRHQTPLIFAAAEGRTDVARLLIERGADPNAATKLVDLMALSRDGTNPDGRNLADKPETRNRRPTTPTGAREGAAPARIRTPGVDRGYLFNEQVHAHGGMTPLLYAARQGYTGLATLLLDAGVDVNQRKAGDDASVLLVATINGHFDLATLLLERGADPNAAAENGARPLYAAVNLEWAPRAGYPQPRAHLNQQSDYLGFMKRLLDKGADPNARVSKKIWYSNYNFDQSGVDESGATAFWRAAYAADIEAMKLLVAYGADPALPTVKPPERGEFGDAGRRELVDVSGLPPVPAGGPGIPPLLAAAGSGYGEGFAGNSHRFAPTGMLAGVKYLVEVLQADVNARDHEGNTALHNAAARGDLEMVKYLVEHGADPHIVNREGQTTVDMANGPVQRIQPWPEVIAYLEALGVKNSHKCLSC
jgi:ankyrin repeat protein